ncbi:MAG: galactokinase [Ruminococcaceae bacterium]|nr:galactokinase [Oscillospiraceae bacterium]
MKSIINTINDIKNGVYDEHFAILYTSEKVSAARERFLGAIDEFASLYGQDREISMFSVSGRSEISGNHTDHNHGRVIAASVSLDIIAIAAKSDSNIVRIKSEGFNQDVVDISELDPDKIRKFNSGAIIAGVCRGFLNEGFSIGGYDAYTTSNVLKGSGISSSAAFEDMVGTILNHFYNDGKVDFITLSKISQYAENVFFGKPCGLMDQIACAAGGFVTIDFEDTKNPVVKRLDFDLSAAGYSLCIVNTGGNHANLNDDYASIPAEMKSVAAAFGKDVLRGLTTEDIFSKAAQLRETVGDRAIMRAVHFINENNRVAAQVECLERGDLDGFFEGVKASGLSSFCYLQNIFTTKNVSEQGLSLALCLCEKLLSGKKAAWRVHGGGFAGTVQAFVPNEYVAQFKEAQEKVFGEGACHVLLVRPEGACKI